MLKNSLQFAWRSLNFFTRLVLVSVLLCGFVFAALMLGLRYWVLPDIERYHADIVAAATHAIGQPVAIESIAADWDGMRPHLRFSHVNILDAKGQTALHLPQIDATAAWTSVLVGALRLHSLELNQPNLWIRRDAQGNLFVAGVSLAGQGSDHSAADWLLNQSHLSVRDARISWLDEQREAGMLVLDQVNLRIENSGSQHRIGMRAVPPSELAAPLDVRGDFVGDSFADLHSWRGTLFTQMDYVDVAAWRGWLPLPAEFKQGQGALRAWVNVEHGKLSQITADVALHGVQARLAEDVQALDLSTLRGRVNWRDTAIALDGKPALGAGFEVATQKFSLQLADGFVLRPTDAYLRLSEAQAAGGEVRANALELTSFVTLMDFLPLDKKLKARLTEFAPQGRVSELQAKWDGALEHPAHYQVQAQLDNVALRRVESFPGFSGLSGKVEGSEHGGKISLDAHNLTLDAPTVMPDALAFHQLSGQGEWQQEADGLQLKFSEIKLENADIAGTVSGGYSSVPNSRGHLDLDIHLSRGDVAHTYRYVPLAALDKETIDWLKTSLLGGQADEFSLDIHGNLDDFPFVNGKSGIFKVTTHARNVRVNYASDWPNVDAPTATLLIQGNRLEVNAPIGNTVGGKLQKVSVNIPDTQAKVMNLQIRGEAAGETARTLDFIQKSPVRGYIDGFTDGMTVSGNGLLTLQVDIPLPGNSAKVTGMYHFAGNDISLSDATPSLRNTTGDLLFTENTLRTKNVSTQILGGAATLDLRNGSKGALLVKVNGRANLDELRRLSPAPVLNVLRGEAAWEANITAFKKQTNVLITSDLQSIHSELPAPFNKAAGVAMPLRFEMRNMAAGQDLMTLQLGELLGAKLLRREEKGEMRIKRGTVNFGNTGKWLDRDGIWLTGHLPQLSLEGWGGVLSGTGGGESDLDIAGAEVSIGKLSGYAHALRDVRLNGRNHNGVLTAQLEAEGVNGDIAWQPQGKGKFSARLKNLSINEDNKEPAKPNNGAALTASNSAAASPVEFPALDIAVDKFVLQGKQLGKLELLAEQHGTDWQVDTLRVSNPDGVLNLNGKWQKSIPQTEVNLTLAISDAGKILHRSGYPDSVKDGSGKLEGSFTWHGAPEDFSYATLDGTLKLETSKGQFLKQPIGVGKLLSILSLQALPKRLTLDFNDVFSSGFAFDSISSTAQINKGVLNTNDFRLEGSAAKVTMRGTVDFNRESVDLHAKVLPTVGNSVSLLSALMLSPAVGIGTFIANKILREPLDKLVSFEYNVTGNWADPQVSKVGAPKPVETEK